jgi:hypothetical protein
VALELAEHFTQPGDHYRAGHTNDEHLGQDSHLLVGLALLLAAIVGIDFAYLPPGDAAATGAAGPSGGQAGTDGSQLAKHHRHNQG